QIADLPPEKIAVRVVKGDQMNSKAILGAIDELKPAPTEAVVYYHLGHGAYNPAAASGDPSGGHFFQLRGGDLYRKQVWDALKAKGAQLTVMITDTCNVPAVPNPSFRYLPPLTRTGDSRVLANLLLDHTGDINVSGSSKDQFGWYSNDIGGWWSDGVCF